MAVVSLGTTSGKVLESGSPARSASVNSDYKVLAIFKVIQVLSRVTMTAKVELPSEHYMTRSSKDLCKRK